jgi:DNA-binding transcriptional MerR regulator
MEEVMQMHTARYGISAAARQVPCAEDTLRALERRDVIHPFRDSAGRRLFTAHDIAAARAHLGRAGHAV